MSRIARGYKRFSSLSRNSIAYDPAYHNLRLTQCLTGLHVSLYIHETQGFRGRRQATTTYMAAPCRNRNLRRIQSRTIRNPSQGRSLVGTITVAYHVAYDWSDRNFVPMSIISRQHGKDHIYGMSPFRANGDFSYCHHAKSYLISYSKPFLAAHSACCSLTMRPYLGRYLCSHYPRWLHRKATT
jgi:hypothetical protein